MNKRKILSTILLGIGMSAYSQETFKGVLTNNDYDVFIHLNLYEENVKIPGQEILGETYGYLKKKTDSRVWVITDVELGDDGKSANIELTNDYGSEDLTAMITLQDDGSYTLKQLNGSTIKVAGKGKWIKLPKVLTFQKNGK